MEAVELRVKGMVDNQLRAAGFNQDLSAGDLTFRSSVQESLMSYAGALSRSKGESMEQGGQAGGEVLEGQEVSEDVANSRKRQVWRG